MGFVEGKLRIVYYEFVIGFGIAWVVKLEVGNVNGGFHTYINNERVTAKQLPGDQLFY